MKTMIRIAIAAAAIATAGTAAAEDWNPISRSSQYIYLADGDSVVQTGNDTTIKVARAPVAGSSRAYRVQTYAFNCADQRFRLVRTAEYDNGAEMDAYDEDGAEYEAVPRNSLIESIKEVACDGNRADPPTWPSMAAYLASLR